MRFLLDTEQRAFADSLGALLKAADTPSVVRDWSRGDPASGRALWRRLAEAGVFALAVPEALGGLGPRPVELAVAFVELGRHAVPGPLVETATAAALLSEAAAAARPPETTTAARPPEATTAALLPEATSRATPAEGPPAPPPVTPGEQHPRQPAGPDERRHPQPAGPEGRRPRRPGASEGQSLRQPGTPGGRRPPRPVVPSAHPQALLTALLRGSALATLAPEGSCALDGDTADILLSLTGDGLRLAPGHGPVRASLDPARRRTSLAGGGALLGTGIRPARALPLARLTTAAQALGVGEALLDRTLAHVRQRTQFGVPVGSFQAVGHRLADAKLALEFARPLVFGAALTLGEADVAAAKASACEAAYATARTALQCHGAIGYTAEYDLSLWLTRARALRGAWGDPDTCRAAVLDAAGRA
ncbi:acyl-CoA dehydrogenase family protein [Streptomyces sp. NPDC093094]|uniref:acyl-CoA dehydrogenase family protein n=1 Tax=Streptomyces sp. NPDC093094 TaxID=3366026 RepID=UPI0037FFE127